MQLQNKITEVQPTLNFASTNNPYNTKTNKQNLHPKLQSRTCLATGLKPKEYDNK